MNIEDIQILDKRIDELLSLCQHLREENHQLRKQQSELHEQREQLMYKNDIARSKIQTMLERLKTIDSFESS